jgi:hypothetical protein
LIRFSGVSIIEKALKTTMIKFFLVTLSVLTLLYLPLFYYMSYSTPKSIVRVLTPAQSITSNTESVATSPNKVSLGLIQTRKSRTNKNAQCNESNPAQAIDKKISKEAKPNTVLFRKSIMNYSVVAFSKNSWCFNQELIQYSSVVSFDPKTELLLVETLVYFVYQKSKQHLEKSAKCLIVIDQETVVMLKQIEVVLMDEYAGNSQLFKVKCVVGKDKHAEKFDKIFVGIIEDESPLEKIKPNGRTFYVNKPSFFDLSVPKKKAIVNCVHTLRSLTSEFFAQMKTWLKINKALGYSKVKLCAVDYNTSYMSEVRREFGDFVEINNFELNLSAVCSNYKNAKAYVCESGNTPYFGGASNFHEKVCTNECLMSYRYEYEFLTNNDIDEIIFARNSSTSFHRSINFNSNKTAENGDGHNCSSVYQSHEGLMETECFKFDMYAYAVKLHRIYGWDVAFFEFDHYLFLSYYDVMMRMIQNENLTTEGLDRYLLYNNYIDNKVKYTVHSEDEKKYFKLVRQLTNLTRCLNATFLVNNPARLHHKWTNVITVPFLNRPGKSLFNTNNTISINQHSGSRLEPGKKPIKVDAKYGYLGHYRNTDTWSMGMNRKSITQIHFDIEYLYFLIRSFPV